MPIQVSITSIKAEGQTLRVGFNAILSGSYTPGGDTINFATAVQDPAFEGTVAYAPALGAPVSLDAWDQSGDIAHGVFAVVGSGITNGKIKFTTAFNTELGAVTYASVGLNTSKIVGEAIFNRL